MALEVGTLNARIKVDTTGVSSSLSSVKRDLNDVKKSADKVEKNTIDVTPKGGDKVQSVSQSARKLGDNLRDAGEAGGRIRVNQQVSSELEKASGAGSKLKGVLSSLSGVAGIVGLGAAVGGVSAAFNDMVQAGNAYRSELNTMNAVSNATESQMRAVSEAAKQLGNDTDLANTSASDAAAAMTELAKGGFSVEESISAAKGTLQLAAAAQVDAASAATIQSQALQAFSLQADDAARVSDILAGAANASSAEIGDVAAALQQSGTVANQFGISIDDTATTLAMFANAGIQGSDAGTLMKSALLSLTDQGKPAQDAIEELGLTVYDANGKFVGMSDLMGQLKEASKGMSDEQFQVATNVLFGSDAMRLAGIAAQQGSEGFDKLKGAVTRQGQAAEVAAAQTEGLPGAIGRAQNAWETAQTQIFEATEGGMVAGLDLATAGIEGLTNLITGPGFAIGGQIFENLGGQVQILAQGAKAAGDVFASVFVPGADDMSEALGKLSGTVEGLNGGLASWQVPVASAALVTFGANALGITGKLNSGTGAVRRFGQEMQVQKALAKGYGKEISTAGAAIDVMRSRSVTLDATLTKAGAAYRTSSANLRKLAADHRAAAAAAREQASTTTRTFGSIGSASQRLSHSFAAVTIDMGAKAKGFASGGLQVMKGAFGGVKSAASGLMGALGGPWGLAIMGASAVIGHLAQKHQEAKQAEQEHEQAQRDLRASLDETTGAITDQTKALVDDELQKSGAREAATDLGLAQSTVRDAIMGNVDAMKEVNRVTQDNIKQSLEGSKHWEAYGGAFEKFGFTIDDVAQALAGNQEQLDRINSDMNTKQMFDPMKKALEDTAGSAMKLGEEVGNLNGQIKSVTTEEAQEQLTQFQESVENTRSVFDLLGDAVFEMPNEKTIKISADQNITDETLKQINQIGEGIEAVRNVDGTVSVSLPEGQSVFQTLESIGAQLAEIQFNGKPYIEIGNNSPEVQRLLSALGVEVETLPDGEVVISSNTTEQIDRLVQLGILVRDEKTGTVTINSNLDTVLQKASQLDARDGKRTSETHTVTLEERRITYWESQGYSSQEAARIQGPVPITSADGNILAPVQAFANGGHRDKNVDRAVARRAQSNHEPAHEAHIAPAGAYRVFAEAETGGEAYIPLAESKRGRSEKILAQVASKFGYQLMGEDGQVQAFANGGVVDSITGLVQRHFPGMTITSTYRNTPDLHGQGKAVDVSNGFDTTPEMQQLARWFYTNFKSQLAELIHYPLNGWKNVDEGQDFNFGEPTNSQHRNHVHIAAHQPLGEPAPKLKNEGLDSLDSLNGVVGMPGYGTVTDAMRGIATSTYSPDGGESESRELNGGAGPLIEDGSFLELMAALYSKQTGTPMADDVVSWGTVVGLYSKESEKKSAKDAEKTATKLEKIQEQLDKANEDLPLAEEDLRIKKMKRDETYNKTDKKGNKTATDSQKAAADQSVAKAEQKVKETKDKIAKLEQEQKELEAEMERLQSGADGLDIYGDLLSTTKGVGGTSGNKYADAIIKEGRRRGITDTGIKIALATALVESGMKMYANPADPASMEMPHDAVGYDHDSVGLFQQRNNGAWGTTADRMDPAKSAGMFYDKLDDADYNTGDPGAHAQRVQASAFPGRYAQRMDEAQGYLDRFNSSSGAKITAMANGGILGGLRQAQINEGDSAVLWAEAGPEAYIPLSSDKRARSLDIWAETGKRLGVDVMSMLNFIGSGLPGLMEGRLDFSTGGTLSAAELGVNMEAAQYRTRRHAQATTQNAVGAVFNGPVQINDPKKYLQGQVDNAGKQLGMAMRSVLL